MLENFIEANKLKARLTQHCIKPNLVKCTLLTAGNSEILVVALAKERIDEKKLQGILKMPMLERIEGLEAEEITGYSAKFLPPISIYGVDVLIDKKVMEMESVFCRVAEEQFLEISPKEILESNENARIEKLF